METNMVPKDELREKAEELLEVAFDFWSLHRNIGGPRAVVWLKSDDGRVVVFTRSDYLETIMRNIQPLAEEIPLESPDESKWIRVTDELPDEDETVWGYDCFYGGQGECRLYRGRLVWDDNNTDCHITHWRRVALEPPPREEIDAVLEEQERRSE